jgi:hypothetical protein
MQCNCKCNSLVTSFPSHQVSIFHTHTFRSLLRVFIAQPTVRDVTPTRAASQIYRSSGIVWHRQPASAHESAPAPNRISLKDGKREILWAHTCPTVSSRPRGRHVQSLFPIGSEMWICIRYKHSSLYIILHYVTRKLTLQLHCSLRSTVIG